MNADTQEQLPVFGIWDIVIWKFNGMLYRVDRVLPGDAYKLVAESYANTRESHDDMQKAYPGICVHASFLMPYNANKQPG